MYWCNYSLVQYSQKSGGKITGTAGALLPEKELHRVHELPSQTAAAAAGAAACMHSHNILLFFFPP